jgi:hypothetical protein
MGQKYASIHIYGGEQDKNLLILKGFYNNDKSMDIRNEQILSIFKNPEVRRIFERQAELSLPDDILILQSDAVISIYDENISFETVEEKAKAISERIENPVLYTSNFDEDVFFLGIYRSGNLITCRKAGDGLSDYDILPAYLDIEKFCQELSLREAASAELLNRSEDIEELEEEMEQLLEAPLNLSLEDIQYGDEPFTELFVEKRVHALKKI